MDGLQIFLIVLASVGGTYILLLIVNLLFVFTFKSYIKRHGKALRLVLTAIYDNVKNLITLSNEKKIKVENKILDIFASISLEKTKEIGSKEYDKTKSDLSYIRESLTIAFEDDEKIKEDQMYLVVKDALEQLQLTYRSYVIMYNADVLGYNYWIRFLPCRYIFLLFRVKQKDICL